jgi:restriction system protein
VQVRNESTLLELQDLFESSQAPIGSGQFIDQRFVDFLAANIEQVRLINWRQFERLVAEYLHRQGYEVELGPGSNDDGVDLRIWPAEPSADAPPLVIVQCKRQHSKVERVVVKGLWADIVANRATRGLVVTTSDLSPGAKQTIQARGYGIDVADGPAVARWVVEMRTPGVGTSSL